MARGWTRVWWEPRVGHHPPEAVWSWPRRGDLFRLGRVVRLRAVLRIRLTHGRLSGEEVELSWVEGALGFSSGGRRLMPGSLGREFAPAARVGRGFYKKVELGGVPDVTPPMIKLVRLWICDPPAP
ncbi:hypothetical protein BHM03_00030147 [Ensete ventricosum]|nr:hypothetical protein BHM03_00030147 [Ensete ventricosum]